MGTTFTRRKLLAATAGLTAGASSGCVSSIGNLLGGGPPNQVSVQIKAQPADQDTASVQIARTLADRLQAVGINATVELLPASQLYKEVLEQHAFDIYVGRFPALPDPDYLYALFHSQYGGDTGWQNPFGFADVGMDQLISRQRTQADGDRAGTIGEALGIVAREQPMSPLVRSDAIAGIGTGRFEGWEQFPARDPLWLVGLQQANGSPVEPQADRSLTVATPDGEPTRSLNPLNRRTNGLEIATSLLYDPLGRYYDGQLQPWLAESWFWSSDDDDELIVRLKPDLQWHDGTPLTAADVAFTYRFYSDATMGKSDTFAPVPRYQGRTDLVSSVRVANDRTVGLEIDAADPVATTALSVPLVPRHVWRERTDVVDADRGLTSAHTSDNEDPVGSGPMVFDSWSNGRSLTLTRNEEHPLNRDTSSRLGSRFNELALTELELLVAPSDITVVEHVAQNNADITSPTLGPSSVDRVEDADGVDLLTTPSRTIYHLGFNTRRPVLRNPNFRRAVVRLLDKQAMADDIFGGYATPLSAPVLGSEWTPESLQFDGTDPQVPFLGSDDELNETDARETFREAGFRYTDGGYLVQR
ncbi:ABC transporter substrate-binding protein [Halapricum sp. CBA1109]|uniref:ABC transporter substrate-binding protein n=1 Tax=Halapricum sp. CBA1109 TaxID=2668068 RepID=UPI0012FB21FB|nr:ABC transporter substrate-binding protein [Halapricum sp. CBA1109]MUV88894.1 ABC transporter substrate-binding protein [Halapricum sp. CBA1109]